MRAGFLLTAIFLSGCGGNDAAYSVTFEPLVGGAAFSCSQTYSNIGISKTTLTPMDFRMYVHGVNLVRVSGAKVPLLLQQDGKWQADDIAFLDFEDGTGACLTASPETHATVIGTAPLQEDYVGIEFTVGLPDDHDHLDATAPKVPAPLNQPAMWWSWAGGYRYIKIDVGSTGNPNGWFFHLGADACSSTSASSVDCKYPDLALISLTPFQTGTAKVALDLATLFADVDLDAQVDGVTDSVPGCMSSTGDPECPALFAKLGLAFEGQGAPPAQRFFTVE